MPEVWSYNLRIDMKDKIASHEKAIEILETIEYAHRRKQVYQDALAGFVGVYLPDLAHKYENNIDTLKRAENRLWERYYKLINKMNDGN